MTTRLIAVAALAALLVLTGCNTVRGFGEDISALGHSLSNATGTRTSSHY